MPGIACAGNWIVDSVKTIDAWPEKGDLVTITKEVRGIGGAAANVLTDLRRLGVDFPSIGLGCIGNDAFGQWVTDHCRKNGIKTDYLFVLDDAETSYTDVMTLAATGERTFFHCRGANALFDSSHVPKELFTGSTLKLFHLGYLLLLDALDSQDSEYGTKAGRLLKSIGDLGLETCVDVVSEASTRFQTVVVPTLPYIDHLIVNEVETERISGIPVRAGEELIISSLVDAARKILDMGVRKTVVIHSPEGGLWVTAGADTYWGETIDIPQNMILGKVGAGDAFCAGILYGLHEGWQPPESLRVANTTAVASLTALNSTDGVGTLPAVNELFDKFGPKGTYGKKL